MKLIVPDNEGSLDWDERRGTFRLLSYWNVLREQRSMPSEAEIDPDAPEIANSWERCFLVQLRDFYKEDFNYTYLGSRIVEAFNGGYTHHDIETGIVTPNANTLIRKYHEVIANKQPILEQGEFFNLRRELVKYRQCLMPLGEADKVEAIFGEMTFKVVK